MNYMEYSHLYLLNNKYSILINLRIWNRTQARLSVIPCLLCGPCKLQIDLPRTSLRYVCIFISCMNLFMSARNKSRNYKKF